MDPSLCLFWLLRGMLNGVLNGLYRNIHTFISMRIGSIFVLNISTICVCMYVCMYVMNAYLYALDKFSMHTYVHTHMHTICLPYLTLYSSCVVSLEEFSILRETILWPPKYLRVDSRTRFSILPSPRGQLSPLYTACVLPLPSVHVCMYVCYVCMYVCMYVMYAYLCSPVASFG